MGKIILEGMEFYAHHGFYKEERSIGNKYEVDVTLEVDFYKAASNDDLSGTINYETVYDIVTSVMEEEAKLLEHLAALIIDKLKASFPQLMRVDVKVSKHNPPIQGLCKKASVILVG